MTVKRALRFATFVSLVLGVVLLIAPDVELDLLEVSKDGDIDVFMRRYAIGFLTLALLFTFASRWEAGRHRRDVLVVGFFTAAAFTISTIVNTVQGNFNAQGWGMTALELFLAGWFGYLVFTGEE
jgi:uncharacterized BrkB/YihY/UPF0761 family membrane protein